MSKYYCEHCNYHTDNKTFFTRHLQTNKHKKYLEEENCDEIHNKKIVKDKKN